jgi:hypothetical protein
MAAGIYNFICEQGATFTRVINATDGAGDPIDLTGYTARMQVRRDMDATAALIELTTENGRISLGGETGEITLTIDADDTSDIPRPGVYDLELESDSGTVIRLLKGAFYLDSEVTR